MELDNAVDLARQAILMGALLAAPVLVVSLAIGVIVGVLQAATQVQEHAVAFVPKLLAVLAVLAVSLPWLVQRLVDYSQTVIVNIPRNTFGG